MKQLERTPWIEVVSEKSEEVTLKAVCTKCSTLHSFSVSTDNFGQWNTGSMVQDAFPDLDKSLRELFISGICNGCRSNLFGNFVKEAIEK